MKSIFKRFREKISFKESPPPYSENEDGDNIHQLRSRSPAEVPVCEVLDLLANCTVSARPDDSQESEVEYAEIEENMGLWHSTPLSHRHKSKISLTWVLKENLENTKSTEKLKNTQERTKKQKSEVDRYRRNSQVYNENERYRKCKSREVKDRVVGRNEYYHQLRFRSACEQFEQDAPSDSSASAGTDATRRRRHKHRRKKKPHARFGYDIRDLDSFLTEATIDRPGNIPVVIAYPSTLYQTHRDRQTELVLPLGTVVNAVFKNKQWLYAQTPHGDEGYVMYSACLPLGILPSKVSPQKKAPCWESSTDIYPRPCGNLTDYDKEHLRGRTRSECRYRTKPDRRRPKDNHAEKHFDTLYLKTKSVASNIDRIHEKENYLKRKTLLVVNCDYKGNVANRTVSVQQGDVVVLLKGQGLSADVDTDWFYVRKGDGSLGYIPASIAGHGYI